jgi:cyanophycin synthetase
MKILKVQTLRGPNYWSIRRHQLILMRLDLEQLDEKFSDQIPGFYEGLVQTLPSLVEHFCSPGYRGGFLERVQSGTLMGHIVEHIALELQSLAGMGVDFGRTRESSSPGVYRVVFEYLNPEAGRYAGRAAVRVCQSLVDTGTYAVTELEQDLKELREIWENAALGPTTEAIVKEAESRNIPWFEWPVRSLVQFGYGIHQRHIQTAQTDRTGVLGVELAGDKEATKIMLQRLGIPVPKGEVIRRFESLEGAIADVGGFPIVLKPLDGNHGRGISLNITSLQQAGIAYDRAKAESKDGSILVEQYCRGQDFRVLVVDGKVVAVAERVPAHVVGDGCLTIAQLVEQTNQDGRRGDGHDNILTRIKVDQASLELLESQGYNLESILSPGQICYLKATANLSTGGIAIDRSDEIHPENIWLCERAARLVQLDIAGIDISAPDLSRPMRENGGVIVEINAAPGLRMHLQPSQGKARNVAIPIVDMLFPPGVPCRVPIIALTGTNGKTTTTRLTAHLFRQTSKVVGYTTTDGTYVGDYLVEAGDNTGPQSAELILNDPTVEIAVLETARGGMLRSGLAFSQCDVGVVLNVSADHLGLHDIDTLEDMAQVKSILAEATAPGGYVVLNAEDPLVAAMAERVKAKVAYFSLNPEHPLIQSHVQKGGLAAVYQQGELVFLEGERVIPIQAAAAVPLTLGGKAPFMIANVLAACLASYVQGVKIPEIVQGLLSFRASVEQTPGRMNLIDLGQIHVLLDYAHNPASYEAVGGFVRNWTTGDRIGVIGAPGDRRDQDFRRLGELAAQFFDWIIVKEDYDNRGRSRGEVAHLILQGIQEFKPNCRHQVILDETTAIQTALEQATGGSLVVILPESVHRALDLIEVARCAKSGIAPSFPC